MWHLKTRQGTFWIIPAENKKGVWLGVDDQPLGHYDSPDAAFHDVHDQQTGFYAWDVNHKIKPPESLTEWEEGEPAEWEHH